MKISMRLTVTDLIRTLRWRAMELAEEAASTAGKGAKNTEPKKNGKS